jgi:hypothetical protein
MVFNAIFNNISVISMLYFIKYNNTMKTQITTHDTLQHEELEVSSEGIKQNMRTMCLYDFIVGKN